jgi:predicted secreted hydrolase
MLRRRAGLAGLLGAALGGSLGGALGGRPAWGATGAAAAPRDDDAIRRGHRLSFPRDHGAHPGAHTEWWYVTGHLRPAAAAPQDAPRWGFQLTFFRSRTGLAEGLPGRFAPRQLLFAHAALTDLGAPGHAASHRHDQRIGRWNGSAATPRAHAGLADTDLALADWTLRRDAASGVYTARLPADDFALDLRLAPTQPLLLQGEQGFSRKGPSEAQASHYLSLPQIAVSGRIARHAPGSAADTAVAGTAWLDHEWSDSLLAPGAEGWDWLGINLFDGSALTAFRLRGAAGSPPVWAGGSYRDAQGRLQDFGPGDVRLEPGRRWTSPATGAVYPVQWTLQTPAGRFTLTALMEGQELDSRAGTGTVYWEGLAALSDATGRRVGLGYLEMTGYAGLLRL